MRFATLDVEGEPAPQGFEPGSFDLVLASNIVHATRDVRETMRRLAALLAPGGSLVLVEATEPLAWLDVTIAMMEGWQRFEDELRTDTPLIATEGWMRVLAETGFAEAVVFPAEGAAEGALGQRVFVARGSSEGTAGAEPAESREPVPVRHAPVPGAFRDRLLAALPAERPRLMLDFVISQVVVVLRLDPARPPSPTHRLMDLGFDSLMAVQLRNRIGKALGLEKALPATLLFDYPTAQAMAGRLLELLVPEQGAASRVAAAQPRERGAAGTAPRGLVDAAAIAGLSDAEIERLLVERQGDLETGGGS